ncbi:MULTISPECIES: PD-(D/E)XK motif protein [unclassified Mesorhizobium]|uniref:PD-(D/E)XK motif protein n=1 Tax=unclassified Mesorhizobium TaxID=325217 RepID=UPI0003CE4EAA|nr:MULTISPECIES: PD-(D/E)XK motif protein [unclassified Mesorhizobium]ESX31583.1 hypothetical protein X765_01630 [Mesorhizobium sp. LSHC440B00]ESX39697.1 hypothetical protein X763_06780 [Mesorhizobium sp. LSHC432A00]ESX44632.1 hypothetical protein X764_05830 [Mesorhizobium sp. LSHC440A00]WJI58916.1 PD-(D/E)XK motif protein [Mesorhizobium sp. C432A]
MLGWTEEGLAKSWRALAKQESNEDWRFVHMTSLGEVSIEAGCYFPAGREALIVAFPRSWPIDSARLPEGAGFDVVLVTDRAAFSGRTAIALVRRAEGAPDIFAAMTVNVLRALERTAGGNAQTVVDAFIERVAEWQAFMARRHRPLSPEAQVGLMGELWMLNRLLDSSLGQDALHCWLGPMRAAQDFHIRGGALEVKSTAGGGGFLARINSIEQLDTDRAPLILGALRFEERDDGQSLVDVVKRLRDRLIETGHRRTFDALLLILGYLDEHAQHYGRVLALKEVGAFLATDDMPRLRRANLPAAIRSAAYVLDLDALNVPALAFTDVLNAFELS